MKQLFVFVAGAVATTQAFAVTTAPVQVSEPGTLGLMAVSAAAVLLLKNRKK